MIENLIELVAIILFFMITRTIDGNKGYNGVSKFTLYTDQNLDRLKNLGDPLADEAVAALVHRPDICKEINVWSDIPEVLPDYFPEEVRVFFSWMKIPPDFIDKQKVLRAQQYFERNGSLYTALLGFFSLPYSYAFADGAQVLVRSKRIMEDVGKRLSETAFFVLDAFLPEAFIGNNGNLLTLAKVRLIHAFARYFIQTHARDWDEKWGTPINQEDLIQTNLAFSFLVMRSMRKIGVSVPILEVEASLHHWKIMGHYLGIDITYWPDSPREAYFIEKRIRTRHLKGSDAGVRLTKALIGYYREFLQNPVVSQVVEDLVAFLMGKVAGDAVGLKQPPTLATPAYQLLLQSNLFGSAGGSTSYQSFRRLFDHNTLKQFGSPIRISIPVLEARKRAS
jgi:hypothetical protein